MILVSLPIRIYSEANGREHWRQVAKRKQGQRMVARDVLQQHARPIDPASVCITLTRVAPRVLDDDNLASGFKAVRDGVADWLGIDDGSERLTWRYEQRKERGVYAAEVAVSWESA